MAQLDLRFEQNHGHTAPGQIPYFLPHFGLFWRATSASYAQIVRSGVFWGALSDSDVGLTKFKRLPHVNGVSLSQHGDYRFFAFCFAGKRLQRLHISLFGTHLHSLLRYHLLFALLCIVLQDLS